MIKMTFRALLVVSMFISTSSSLMAESKTTPKIKPLTPKAEKAAYALFRTLKMKEGIRLAMDRSLEIQIRRQPAMAPYEDIYKKFFHKYTKWEDMKRDLAKLYAQALSPEEMDKLTKFYSTRVGQKSLTILPKLTQLSMLLAQQRIAKHAKELRSAVEKRAKKLQSQVSK